MLALNKALSFNDDTDFLKLIAVFAMFLDHLGKIFFKDLIALQIIGRISFPLFAYCLSVGAVHTKDMKKYMLRIGLFALITQPIYILAFLPHISDVGAFFATCVRYKNILFTLLTGLIAIYGAKERNWGALLAALGLSLFGGLDYGIYGVSLILAFYLFRNDVYKSLACSAILIGAQFFLKNDVALFGLSFGKNCFGLFALPLVYFKTDLKIAVNKYLFYIFYPAHFLLFYIVQL